jgi:hypothetical protein
MRGGDEGPAEISVGRFVNTRRRRRGRPFVCGGRVRVSVSECGLQASALFHDNLHGQIAHCLKVGVSLPSVRAAPFTSRPRTCRISDHRSSSDRSIRRGPVVDGLRSGAVSRRGETPTPGGLTGPTGLSVRKRGVGYRRVVSETIGFRRGGVLRVCRKAGFSRVLCMTCLLSEVWRTSWGGRHQRRGCMCLALPASATYTIYLSCARPFFLSAGPSVE